MVLLLLAVVRNDLVEDWQKSLPADTPNHFLINIPAAETGAFADYFTQRGMAEPRLYPMIRARLTSINGRPVSELALASDRRGASPSASRT
jgi:putative ABC transport system permease protein